MSSTIQVKATIVGSSSTKTAEIKVVSPVVEAYWADKDNKKMTLPVYDDHRVNIYLNVNKSAYNRKITLNVYAISTDKSKKVLVGEREYIADETPQQSVTVELTGKMFKKGEATLKDKDNELIQYLFFEIIINGIPYSTEHNAEDYLHFHYIRFVPTILQNKGWTKAKQMQDLWFKAEANATPWSYDPKIDLIPMSWIRGFDRMQLAINNFKTSYNLFTEHSKPLLEKRIATMIESGDIILPEEGSSTNFGTNSKQIVPVIVKQPKLEKMVVERMPLFEKYYFQSKAYTISVAETLDDCFGTLASCQLRAVAFGTLTTRKRNKTANGELILADITITKVGIYVKDSFDFIIKPGHESELLGYWEEETNDVSRGIRGDFSPGYKIHNKIYNDWQKDYKTGGDFQLYSTMDMYPISKIYNNCPIFIKK